MEPLPRRVVIAGAVVLFGVGLLLGFLLGRTGDDGPGPVAQPSPSPSTSISVAPPVVVTPSPGDAPAITSEGQILQEGERPVNPAPSNAACGALIDPGTLGSCGEVLVAAQRVVWVVQQATTPTGSPAFTVRISTYVLDAGGWVEWLQAADPTGERWSDANVLASDLTGDGVPELLVGFRAIGEARTLEYDVVGYSQVNLPEVLAHPDAAARGSVVVSAGTISEYSAQYPNGEPLCCPVSFLRRTISFQDGFFRVSGSETVLTAAVPISQI